MLGGREKCRRSQRSSVAVSLPDARCVVGEVLSYAAAMTATVKSAPKRGPLMEKALAAANKAGIKVIPHLPAVLKRLLSGGRAITIDGNTLDPSLQMVLAAQRATGLQGLTVADDVIATRLQVRATSAAVDEPHVHVAQTTPVSIPGPAGNHPAFHHRPLGFDCPKRILYPGCRPRRQTFVYSGCMKVTGLPEIQ